MDPRSVTLCLLHSALKWPNRLDAILKCASYPPSPDPVYGSIWQAIMHVRSANPGNVEASTFRERVLAAVQLEAPAYSGNAANLISHVGNSEVPTEQFCIDLLKRYAKQRLFEAMPDLNVNGAEQVFLRQLTAIDSLTGNHVPEKLDLFANGGRDYLAPNPIFKTGFFLMDEPFGGLFPAGRLVLYVIPTKSGKTLYSLQLSKHLVERGMNVMYMNFEQEAKGDLAVRMYMMASDTPKALWEQIASFDDLPTDVRSRLAEREPLWKQHFCGYSAEQFEDPEALNHGADSIKHMIQTTYIDRGLPIPDLIIVDWWKELWERCRASLQASGRSWSPAEERAQEFMHFKKLKLMAQALGTRVIVFMQMRTAILATPASTNIDKLTCFDAAENKALPNYADAAFVTTKLDPNDPECKVTFKLDVCRFSRPGWRSTAIMNGDMQLFEKANLYDTSRAANVDFDDGGIIVN